MTSNAGSRQIGADSRMGFASSKEGLLPYEDLKASAMEELKKLMPPELLNRIDDVVVFNALTKEEVNAILDIQMRELEDRLVKVHAKAFSVAVYDYLGCISPFSAKKKVCNAILYVPLNQAAHRAGPHGWLVAIFHHEFAGLGL